MVSAPTNPRTHQSAGVKAGMRVLGGIGQAWNGNLAKVRLLPWSTTLSSRVEERAGCTQRVGHSREGNQCAPLHPGSQPGQPGIRQIMPLVRTGDCCEGEAKSGGPVPVQISPGVKTEPPGRRHPGCQALIPHPSHQTPKKGLFPGCRFLGFIN